MTPTPILTPLTLPLRSFVQILAHNVCSLSHNIVVTCCLGHVVLDCVSTSLEHISRVDVSDIDVHRVN